MITLIIIKFVRLLLILPFYLSNIFACNCSYEKNVIVRSNREYDYFGNVLEYEYDYFPSSTSTQKVHEYNYSISEFFVILSYLSRVLFYYHIVMLITFIYMYLKKNIICIYSLFIYVFYSS